MMRLSKQAPLIIVSSRLPVTVSKLGNDLHFKASSGGLATGVSSVSKTRKSTWVGWPGIAKDDLSKQDQIKIIHELKKHDCHPVFLTQKQIDQYYSGYSNSSLWPLFHYFVNKASFSTDYWAGYKQVNELFAKETQQFINKNSQIWLHDYHLMLLPALLRNFQQDASVGFFLHTPFPSFELFRVLPEREELLKGMLGANLIGFHTYDYVRHFLSSVQRTIGYENNLGRIQQSNHMVHADAFPIGIDYKLFSKKPTSKKLKLVAAKLLPKRRSTKIILSVDRADYSKGIPARLDAINLFLNKYPEYLGKVTFVIQTVPSRESIDAYQDLLSTVEQKIGSINGAFSTVDWSPIIYLHKSLPQREVQALYSQASIMLVTPLRDGMNLVAKEYVATHHNQAGVLILSEMAGAASELTDALQVNPFNIDMVASTIKTAIEMPEKEQKSRMKKMQSRAAEYDISKWANDYLRQLTKINEPDAHSAKQMNEKTKTSIQNHYQKANSRLILLDYDGTLRDFVSSPKASMARPSRKVLKVLKKLSKDQRNKIVIVSGRPKTALELFFKGIGLGIVAEHGGWVMEAGQWVKSSVSTVKWKKLIIKTLESYTARTPGSNLEEKDFSFVWHYRNVSPELAYVRSEELKTELQSILEDTDIGVYDGQKVIEIKPQRMHKGTIATKLLMERKWDFTMALGDDYTDEDMFHAMPEDGISINVGNRETDARYQLKNTGEVIDLLSHLSQLDKSIV